MLREEALVILANFSLTMSGKIEEPILHVRGWINGRISIAVAWSYSCMIWDTCLPSPLWYREPNGNQVWPWDWRNKSRSIIVSRTPVQKSFISLPTSHFPPSLSQSRNMQMPHTEYGWNQPTDASTKEVTGKH